MGIVSDLATLIGAGAKWDDIKAIAEIEKAGTKHDVSEQKGKGETEETKPNEDGTGTPEPKDEPRKEDTSSEESVDELKKQLENTQKQLADANAKVEKLQKANQNRNLDDGSTKSEQDLLNDIMLDMF